MALGEPYMKKKRALMALSVGILATAAYAWSYSWTWTNDVWTTPTYSYYPIVRSKMVTLSNQYRVEVLHAASSYNWNPGIIIECVNASTGFVAWSDHFPTGPGNRWSVAQRGVPPGVYYINVRSKASQFGSTNPATQVVIGPTYYFW